MLAFRHAGIGFGHRLLAGGGVLWISKSLKLEKRLRVDQRVELSELRARDRVRYRRILQYGIVDFPIEGSLFVNVSTISRKNEFINTGQLSVSGSSEIVPCRLISSNTVAMVFQLQVHLCRRRICVILVTR
ncbi:PREDICTED: uncharacterized protein LOC104610826 [Nelumbo nucifera]|uniref:Uncharacterized protein n=2 Tax=Nelumbo nucifera TaxID=4432 RepID=A0A822YMF9_NELNU|nr:PREDICTED: uncharacterized protein LOC104610826 [Nelumbo nucifera]DAD33790.1 TPA_asm: hypothetical protein HUJ06_012640 [Nelumbo nucifera]